MLSFQDAWQQIFRFSLKKQKAPVCCLESLQSALLIWSFFNFNLKPWNVRQASRALINGRSLMPFEYCQMSIKMFFFVWMHPLVERGTKVRSQHYFLYSFIGACLQLQHMVLMVQNIYFDITLFCFVSLIFYLDSFLTYSVLLYKSAI